MQEDIGERLLPSMLVNELGTWMTVLGVELRLGLMFDHLSAVMLLFITGIGSLIVMYSTAYMAEDRGLTRFLAYLNLFWRR